MFRIASGDPWPDSLPILDENGSIDYRTCLYMCSFIIIVCWVSYPCYPVLIVVRLVKTLQRHTSRLIFAGWICCPRTSAPAAIFSACSSSSAFLNSACKCVYYFQ